MHKKQHKKAHTSHSEHTLYIKEQSQQGTASLLLRSHRTTHYKTMLQIAHHKFQHNKKQGAPDKPIAKKQISTQQAQKAITYTTKPANNTIFATKTQKTRLRTK